MDREPHQANYADHHSRHRLHRRAADRAMPEDLMLRELVMNAIEAAAMAPEGRRVIEIKGKAVPECGDARKLTIWNTGPGMTSGELDNICDLAASIGKDMAVEGN